MMSDVHHSDAESYIDSEPETGDKVDIQVKSVTEQMKEANIKAGVSVPYANEVDRVTDIQLKDFKVTGGLRCPENSKCQNIFFSPLISLLYGPMSQQEKNQTPSFLFAIRTGCRFLTLRT